MSKGYDLQLGKETWRELENIYRFGYSYSTIFSDFLDTCIYSLLSFTDNLQYRDIIDRFRQNKLTGKYEDQYMQLVAKYRENKTREKEHRPIDYFAQAFRLLQKETRESQQEILGGIFEAKISLGEHGQFFTPFNVADMMAQMIAGEVQKPGETVCDPACGSGRLLLSYAKVNKDARFYGIDLSSNCAKMTALNMWLFNLHADIYHGDSLTEKYFHVWKVRRGGCIYESEITERSPKPPSIKESLKQQPEQQRLFHIDETQKERR